MTEESDARAEQERLDHGAGNATLLSGGGTEATAAMRLSDEFRSRLFISNLTVILFFVFLHFTPFQ